MIETETNLPQKKMKMFSGHSAERIEPVFGIAPEAFDPVDVISTFRSASLLPDHYVVSLDAQRTVCLPVVGVVETAGLGVRTDQPDHSLPFSCGNREHLHLAVALQDPQYDDFAGGTPTSFAVPSPANRGLVALDGSHEPFALFLAMHTAGLYQTIEAFDRRSARGGPESLPARPVTRRTESSSSRLLVTSASRIEVKAVIRV